MKIYVINLDRAPERMARMDALLSGMGLAYERVRAVDGRLLPPPATTGHDGAYVLARAEIACALSHQKCWDLFDRSGDAHCLILEDDVHLSAGLADFVSRAADLPAGMDLIKIESLLAPIWLDRRASHRSADGRRAWLRLASGHMGSAGYALSRGGLAKLRRLTETIAKPIDVVLFGDPSDGLLAYQMSPSLVVQDRVLKGVSADHVGLDSAIAGESGRKPRVRGVRKLLRELHRPFRYVFPPGPWFRKPRLRCGVVGFE